MCIDFPQAVCFVDAKESRIQAENRSKMGSAVPPVLDLLMLRIRLCRFRNVEMWAVPSWKDFDLLILRNRVFWLQNVQIWVVLSCKVVYLQCSGIVFHNWKRADWAFTNYNYVSLQIVTNGIFRLRKVQIRSTPSCKRVELLMLRNSIFRVRNVEICTV